MREEVLARKRRESLVKAQKMVKKWETAVKRSNTMLMKWYKRRLAAEKRIAWAAEVEAVARRQAQASGTIGRPGRKFRLEETA